MRRRAGLAACALAALVVAVGCTRGSTSARPPIHTNPNMDSQPKVRPFDASPWFADGMAMRPPVEGTVARGELYADPVYLTGSTPDGTFAATIPVPVDPALLARGAERFGIYCEPCHGGRGNGKGPVAVRGGIPAANLVEDARLLAMPPGQIYSAVRAGVGLMPAFSRVPIEDRWAIVAHVEELQGR